MAMTPRSLPKIYAQVMGTKFYYHILIANEKSPDCCSKWETKIIKRRKNKNKQTKQNTHEDEKNTSNKN